MDNEWKIIESDMGNGKKEYQVSNGNVGKTLITYLMQRLH